MEISEKMLLLQFGWTKPLTSVTDKTNPNLSWHLRLTLEDVTLDVFSDVRDDWETLINQAYN